MKRKHFCFKRRQQQQQQQWWRWERRQLVWWQGVYTHRHGLVAGPESIFEVLYMTPKLQNVETLFYASKVNSHSIPLCENSHIKNVRHVLHKPNVFTVTIKASKMCYYHSTRKRERRRKKTTSSVPIWTLANPNASLYDPTVSFHSLYEHFLWNVRKARHRTFLSCRYLSWPRKHYKSARAHTNTMQNTIVCLIGRFVAFVSEIMRRI